MITEAHAFMVMDDMNYSMNKSSLDDYIIFSAVSTN